jgi:hypothetical protein
MIGKQRRQLMMEEKTMRLGFTVPQFGPDAGPDALLEVARLAEDLGYDRPVGSRTPSLPSEPQSPLPGDRRRFATARVPALARSPGGSRVPRGGDEPSPDRQLHQLTFHNPVLLARELSRSTVLSNGRLGHRLRCGLVDRTSSRP